MSVEERLQKVLAAAGVASRRASEDLIRQGRVQVNGQVITEQGVKVDPENDDIRVDDVPIARVIPKRYFMLYKPVGVLSTASDELGRQTVLDLVPSSERLYPVGRLDAESEGLVLLTNDGELTNYLTHPRYGHKREYRALVWGRPTEAQLNKLRRGVILEDGPTGPALVEIVGPAGCQRDNLPLPDRDRTWLKIVIGEGRKHQVRRMCEITGHPVVRLIRVQMGPLRLGSLPEGKYRALRDDEISKLRSIVTTGKKKPIRRPGPPPQKAVVPSRQRPPTGKPSPEKKPTKRSRS